MRLYFHLVSTDEVIRDREGVEVADLHEARAQAVRAIRELRQKDPSAPRDWSGWTLTVADESEAVVFSLDLDADTL